MLVTPSDLIRDSYDLCVKNWKRLVVYLILLAAPSIVMMLVNILMYYATGYSSILNILIRILSLLVTIAAGVFTLLVALALTKEVKSIWQKQPAVEWKTALMGCLDILWPAIYTSIFVSLIVFAGCLLLIVPGIIFMVWYIFTIYILVFEGKKGVEAMKASKQLVVGRWGAIALRFFGPVLLFTVAIMIAQYIVMYPFAHFINSYIAFFVISTLVSTILSSVMTPLMMAVGVMLYASAKENPILISQSPKPETSK